MAFDPKSKLTGVGLPESNSLGLRFDNQNDVFDYVDKLVQDCEDFLAVKKLNFVERYKVGSLELNIEFMSSRHSGKYQLVFVAIPECSAPKGWSIIT